MVVAFLTTEYPTEPSFAGGLASYLGRIATALAGAGHDVEVFVTGASNETYVQDGVRVSRLRPAPRWQPRVGGRPFVWQFQEASRIHDQAEAFERAVSARSAERRIDVVQAPDFMAPGLTLALGGGVPVVTRLSHYGPLWQAAYRFASTAALRQQNVSERYQMRASRAVYAPSRFLADHVARAEGIEVGVVRPPFDVAAIACHRDREPGFGVTRGAYALFFGTIGLMKGADRLVSVLPEVLRACPDMRFVFAGNARASDSGEPFDRIIGRQFGADRVMVVPAVRHDVLLPLVAGARFAVLPSRVENLPNACLEAMALGRPVLATAGVSFEELITDGVSGALVSQDDDAELARAMMDLWQMPPSRLSAMGDAARAAILSRFGPDQTLGPLVELFEKAAGAPRRRSAPGRARYVGELLATIRGRSRASSPA
jgi:glycosyltransferase involved in cell wall biosynthesis